MSSFVAMAIQSNVKMVDSTASKAEVKRTIRENLARGLELVDWAAAHRHGRGLGPPIPMLIGFPESFLHAFPRSEGAQLENMLKVAIEIPGEETALLAEKAQKYNAYIFGASYAVEPDWPNRYFNTGFIIDPQGQVALKYRKLYCGAIESGTSPHDVLDAYLERYGQEALFPVLDTPLGKLAVMICADGLFGPEVARAYAMRGAEVLCYPISTTSPDHFYYHLAAQARALDNVCYLVSPNLGMTLAKERAANTGGESVIVDFQGRILQKANTTGESTISETLHLDALRRYRLRAAHGVINLRTEAFAWLYQQPFFPVNAFLDRPEQNLDDEVRLRQQATERALARHIVMPPPEQAVRT